MDRYTGYRKGHEGDPQFEEIDEIGNDMLSTIQELEGQRDALGAFYDDLEDLPSSEQNSKKMATILKLYTKKEEMAESMRSALAKRWGREDF